MLPSCPIIDVRCTLGQTLLNSLLTESYEEFYWNPFINSLHNSFPYFIQRYINLKNTYGFIKSVSLLPSTNTYFIMPDTVHFTIMMKQQPFKTTIVLISVE